MAVSKKILVLLLLSIPLSLLAQTSENSLRVRNKSVEKTLEVVEKTFNVYFSYDPQIFAKEPTLSLSLEKASLTTVLENVLSPRYAFTIIGEYVVVTAKKDKPKSVSSKAETQAKVPVANSPIFDTVRIEKIIVRYDTQKVTQVIPIYDTILVEKIKTIYDTVSTSSRRSKKFPLMPEIEISRWHSSATDKSVAVLYNSIRGGVSKEFPIGKLIGSAGIGYTYLFRNFSYINKIDSMQPIWDTAALNTLQERINLLGFLSGRLGIGYTKKYAHTTLGAHIGTTLHYAMRVDEKRLQHDGTISTLTRSTYRTPLINSYVSVSIKVKFTNTASLVLSPRFEYGLSREYSNQSTTKARYSYGLTIGISPH